MQKIYDISETTKPDHQRTICVLISTRLPFGFLNCDEVEYMNPAGGGDISLSNIPYATCQVPGAKRIQVQMPNLMTLAQLIVFLRWRVR